MQEVLLVIHLMLAIAIVITVLLQRSEGGALGMGGGGGSGGGGGAPLHLRQLLDLALSPLCHLGCEIPEAFSSREPENLRSFTQEICSAMIQGQQRRDKHRRGQTRNTRISLGLR